MRHYRWRVGATLALFLLPIAVQLHPLNYRTIATQLKTSVLDSCYSDTVRLLFTGDIMYHMPQVKAAERGHNKFDFDPSWQALKPYIESADLAVGNLETTLGRQNFSGYPNFCTPDTLAYTLKRVGFDVITTANNHAADRGVVGIRHTIQKLQEVGLHTTGSYLDHIDRRRRAPLMIEVGGIRIALLAYTYGTNGIRLPSPYEVALIDTVEMRAQIAEAKGQQADLICISIHWGDEYQHKPNETQRKLALWLKEVGVQAVVGSHPHVRQPLSVDTLSSRPDRVNLLPVFYSLGNLISNQSQRGTQEGALAIISIVKDRQGTRIVACEEIATFCHRRSRVRSRYLVVPKKDCKKWAHLMNV